MVPARSRLRRDVHRGRGLGEAVRLAQAGADHDTQLRALPPTAAEDIGLVGSLDTVRTRLTAFAESGLGELVVVPATSGDPGARRTLTALAPFR